MGHWVSFPSILVIFYQVRPCGLRVFSSSLPVRIVFFFFFFFYTLGFPRPFPVKTYLSIHAWLRHLLPLKPLCQAPPRPPPPVFCCMFLRNARSVFCFVFSLKKKKTNVFFFLLLLVRCSKSLFRFFCNVCFLRKIKCILILKKTKLTPSSLF